MKNGLKRKLGALFMSAAVAIGSIAAVPVFADDGIKIIFEDITDEDVNTLKGEAKILVSVDMGDLSGDVSIAQTILKFDLDGGMKFKAIEYLQGENDYENQKMLLMPNVALANVNGEIKTSIMSVGDEPLYFEGVTDLFILTFAGEEGDTLSLSLNENLDSTYCKMQDTKFTAMTDPETGVPTITDVIPSDKDNIGKNASVKLVMNQVMGFADVGSIDDQYDDTRLTLTITRQKENEDDPDYIISTAINNVSLSKGGHRDTSETASTYVLENVVLDNYLYTVELSGPGFTTFYMEDVSFDEELVIDNTVFIPGDVNNDGLVDIEDKKIVLKAESMDSLMNKYEGAPDINRNGVIDDLDLEIFNSIPGEIPEDEEPGDDEETGDGTTTPGDDNKDDEEEDKDSGKDDEEDDDKTQTGSNQKPSTKPSTVGGNAGGGGGGASSGGGGGGATTPVDKEPDKADTAAEKTFTDLGNHAWAEDAICTLKAKNIISGVSETEFAPGNNIKRGDFILILTRMLNINNVFEDNFADVPAGMYYYNAIGSAKAAGIATGDGTNFMPENTITRQDLITLAYRAFVSLGYIEEQNDGSTANLDAFGDKALIDDYALNALNTMVGEGIIQGSDGNVNPKGFATRAEVAVMCSRLLNLQS